MHLKDKINQDLSAAFKGGDNDTVASLRFLNSVIKNKELEKRTKLAKEGKPIDELPKLSELSDEEVAKVVLSEIKKRKEAIIQYEIGKRNDLVAKETTELAILKKYAPEEISEDELRALIKEKLNSLNEVSMKDFGKIIGMIMAETQNRADGALVIKIIEEEIKLRNM